MFQETLIVWSENDTTELALSFQERAGCDEIWAKICQVKYSLIIWLLLGIFEFFDVKSDLNTVCFVNML